MTGFDSIIDQQRPIRILTTFLKKNAIPHALLFSGICGVGKTAAALTFAKACNCLANDKNDEPPHGGAKKESPAIPTKAMPCHGCRVCRLIQAGGHPDIIGIKPQGRQIRIEQIRALNDTLALKPYEARMRVVIISDAEKMNPSAGNALLKMLEEPPAQTMIILTTTQPSNVLPTIISRCQHIRFNPTSRQRIQNVLLDQKDADVAQAAVVAALANGSLERAVALCRSDWIKNRQWLLEASGLDQPQDMANRPLRLLLAFAGQLVADPDTIEEALDILAAWLRDLLISHDAPKQVINVDLIDKIQYTASKNTAHALLAKLDIIIAAQNELQRNTNMRLNLEHMMLKLARA